MLLILDKIFEDNNDFVRKDTDKRPRFPWTTELGI